jgi:hypothetical protein
LSTWTFDDGSTLTSGGTVSGEGVAATELRRFLALPDTERVVTVAPGTSRRVVLDAGSDYLLNVCVRALSFRLRQRVRTDYLGCYADAPPYVRRILDAADLPFARRAL